MQMCAYAGRAVLHLAASKSGNSLQIEERHRCAHMCTDLGAAPQESIRGCDVFLVQPSCPPVNDHLMELLVTIDACKRASARSITAVIPYYGYARADRKTHGRESIAAKLTANLLTEAGARAPSAASQVPSATQVMMPCCHAMFAHRPLARLANATSPARLVGCQTYRWRRALSIWWGCLLTFARRPQALAVSDSHVTVL